MTDIDGGTGKPTSTTVAQVMYILHALAPFTFWSLALVAVIIGAVNRGAVRGSYVESHYVWLGRTFWYGMGLLIVLTVIFFVTVIGILFLWLLWFGLTVWYLWRVIRGWLALNNGKHAPA